MSVMLFYVAIANYSTNYSLNIIKDLIWKAKTQRFLAVKM